MEIAPASFDQIRIASDGRIVTISADSGGVAEGLRRLDPCLRLRYSEPGKCYIVYRLHRHGEVCADDDPERTEELVLTAQECDQRIVDRLAFIDPEGRGGYDYGAEIEKTTVQASRQRKQDFAEKTGEMLEQTAHALRKDLGERYRGRSFVPRDLD